MGIYDREYYRRDGPSFLGSLADRGAGIKWLVGITIGCFIIQFITRGPAEEPVTEFFLLDVNKVAAGEVWRLVTYAFLHSTDNIGHILFNMLALWFFGRAVEDRLGTREFVAFYLVAAVVSGLAYWAGSAMELQKGAAVGASGAVMAVLLLSALINPRQTVLLFFILPVPIWGFIAFIVLKDALDLFGKANNGIGSAAHLGGAAFGAIYYAAGARLTAWTLTWPEWTKARARPRLKIYRDVEETEAPTAPLIKPTTPQLDEQLEAQMDAILAKIQRVGMGGLSESERQLLQRASEALKQRKR